MLQWRRKFSNCFSNPSVSFDRFYYLIYDYNFVWTIQGSKIWHTHTHYWPKWFICWCHLLKPYYLQIIYTEKAPNVAFPSSFFKHMEDWKSLTNRVFYYIQHIFIGNFCHALGDRWTTGSNLWDSSNLNLNNDVLYMQKVIVSPWLWSKLAFSHIKMITNKKWG